MTVDAFLRFTRGVEPGGAGCGSKSAGCVNSSWRRVGQSESWASDGRRSHARWPQDRPPKYERPAVPTLFTPFKPAVRQLLVKKPDMPVTVIAERVGWSGSITWLRDNVPRGWPTVSDRAESLPCARTPRLPCRVSAAIGSIDDLTAIHDADAPQAPFFGPLPICLLAFTDAWRTAFVGIPAPDTPEARRGFSRPSL